MTTNTNASTAIRARGGFVMRRLAASLDIAAQHAPPALAQQVGAGIRGVEAARLAGRFDNPHAAMAALMAQIWPLLEHLPKSDLVALVQDLEQGAPAA